MIAEVGFSTGRHFLSVAGITLAMEGDKIREILPEEALKPIPPEELERATIGDQRATDVPLHVVRFFRSDYWCKKSLQWVADRVNAVASGRAREYTQDEAIAASEKK